MDAPGESSQPLFLHKPVLIEEVIEYLNVQPGKTYLDVTFGSGGHTRAILQADPDCRVIGMDWDRVSLDTYAPVFEEEFGDRFIPLWGNFGHLYKLLKTVHKGKVDGILADFGTSQMQITQRPGFSIYRNKDLDMRMSPSYQKVTAAHVIAKSREQDLANIFWELGQERYSRRIARVIVEKRGQDPITTTAQLADLVERVIPNPTRKKPKIHPATRVFQALRMYVNRELDNIRSFLPIAVDLLNPGGRLVCISFHSLEDGLVKTFFREQDRAGTIRIMTPKVIIPSDEEVQRNPSSRSSKLRAAERL